MFLRAHAQIISRACTDCSNGSYTLVPVQAALQEEGPGYEATME